MISEAERYFTTKYNSLTYEQRVEIGDYTLMMQIQELRFIKEKIRLAHNRQMGEVNERINILVKELEKRKGGWDE